MPKLSDFERYINHLCEVLGHQTVMSGSRITVED